MGDRLPAGIDMCYLATGRGGVQAGNAGIGKQVEYAWFAVWRSGGVCRPDFCGAPIPVTGLFGEKAKMAKGRWPGTKAQRLIVNLPVRRQAVAQFPAATLPLITITLNAP